MKNIINCLVNHNSVINSKLREVSVEEGLAIAEELFQILNKRGDGIGLAANQVGIDAQVAVVNVIEPLVLINPKYISKQNEIGYGEGCLSFPGHAIRTKRYQDIIISTEQSESNWYFSGVDGDDKENRLLEAVCVQHEIDHLMGKTMHDREVKLEPTKVEKKIGRNQKVLIACGADSKVVKYKKAIPLLENGWTLVESE